MYVICHEGRPVTAYHYLADAIRHAARLEGRVAIYDSWGLVYER